MQKKWKAIFFDFDGVLVLSEPIHFRAWKRLLEDKKWIHEGFTLKNVMGISDYKIAETLIQKNHLSLSEEEMIGLKEKYYHQFYDTLAAPRGRDKFLKAVSEDFSLHIVSSSFTEDIQEILQKQKIFHYFDLIVGGNDTKRHKPFPDPYLLALKRSGFAPEEVFVIEDSAVGIEAALAAKIPVVGMKSEVPLPKKFPIPFFEDYVEIAGKFLGKKI